jgi:hypothetical protein
MEVEGNHIKFRENFDKGEVEVLLDDGSGFKVVFSDDCYGTSAEWAQKYFRLSDNYLMELYEDYREDYDKQREED